MKTDPARYRYNDLAEALFLDRCGKDIWYRVRTKECGKCGGHFDTAELDKRFLHRLIQGMLADHDRKVELEMALRDRTAELTAALDRQERVAGRAMNTLAELRNSTLGRQGLTLVPTVRAPEESTVQ